MNLLASGVWQTIGSVALAILVLLAMGFTFTKAAIKNDGVQDLKLQP